MSERQLYGPDTKFPMKYAAVIDQAEKVNFRCDQVDLTKAKEDVQAALEGDQLVRKLEAEAKRARTQFRKDQVERYKRFARLVNGMAGVYKDDPAVMAVLAQARRKGGRRRKETAEPTQSRSRDHERPS